VFLTLLLHWYIKWGLKNPKPRSIKLKFKLTLNLICNNPSDLSPTSSNNLISIISRSIKTSTINLTLQKSSTLLISAAVLFRSLNSNGVGGNNNKVSTQTLQLIMKKIGLGSEVLTGNVFDASNPDIGLTVYRYASVSTIPNFTPVTTKYYSVTFPTLQINYIPSLIDLIVYRYPSFYGDNYINNTFSTLGIEFIEKDNNNVIPITGLVAPIIIQITGSNQNSSSCMYFDYVTNSWVSDGIGSLGLSNGQLICNSTHLTEFSGFLMPPQPSEPSKLLYLLLLLLLLVPLIAIIFVLLSFGVLVLGVSVFVGAGLLGKKIFSSKDRTTTYNVTATDKDMVDLGI